MILLITAYFLRFGFDLTDESYYFNWIVGWENYGGSPSMFGPFLGWFLGDVTLHSMRLIGFVTLTTSAILVGYSLRGSGSDSRATYSIVFICALGGVAHLAWISWVPTPNYNLLTLIGLLLFAAGYLPAFTNSNINVSAPLIAISAVIVFMGKPVSALFLAIIFPLLLFRYSFIDFFAFVLRSGAWFAIFFSTVLLILFDSYSNAIEFLSYGVSSSHRELGLLTTISILKWPSLAVGLFCCLLALAGRSQNFRWTQKFSFLRHQASRNRKSAIGFKKLALLLFIPSFLAVMTMSGKAPYYWTSLIPVYLGCVCCHLIGPSPMPTHLLAQSATPVFLSLAYVLGTGNPYGFQITGAWVFLMLSPAVFWSNIPLQTFERRLSNAFLVITNILCVSLLLFNSISLPYRQPNSAYDYSFNLKELNPKLNVLVDENDSNFYRQLRDLANEAEIPSGAPFLDFSGQTPGISIFLQTVHLGSPWHIGSEPGARKRFIFYLRSNCQFLPSSWLVDEPAGKYRHHLNVLEDFNLSIKSDYTEIHRLEWRGREFVIYQPLELKKLNQDCELITSQN